MSGISPSVTKEVLEKEFLKFGKIEEFKFLRERNTAYIDYFRLEDASQALKSMNGKRIGGDQIRVDFLRSHTSRRVCQLCESQFGSALDYVFIARIKFRDCSNSNQSGRSWRFGGLKF